MNKTDIKTLRIIGSIINNCRLPIVSIAKQVGLSRESVSSKIHYLEKEKIIRAYTCEINFNKLGFEAYSISIKLQNISLSIDEKIISKLLKIQNLVFLEQTLSKYDLVGTLIVKSKYALEQKLKVIREIIGVNLRTIDIDVFLGDFDFLSSIFSKYITDSVELNYFTKGNIFLDDFDKEIIQLLTDNSRVSINELASKINLSVFAIAKRIKKLQKEGVIVAFRPLIDFGKLNLHRYTLILNFTNYKNEKKLIEYCRQDKNIWGIGNFIGNYNYAIEMFAKNNDEFKLIASKLLNEFTDSIIEYESLIVLSELKHNYFFL